MSPSDKLPRRRGWHRADLTRWRRALVAVTALLGAAGALGGLDPHAQFSDAVRGSQLAMSLTLPFVTALAAHDARREWRRERDHRRWPLRGLLVAGTSLALVAAAWGVIAAAAAAAAGGHQLGARAVAFALVGAAAVQMTAQLIGTGFGLLLSSAWLAAAATVIAPLTVYALLAVLHAADWVAPYAVARDLLAAEPSTTVWLRWFVVTALWGLALHGFAGKDVRTGTRS